jgi:hypothetical protein
VALHLAGAGHLAAGEPGSADVVVRREPAVEWMVTGVAPGVAVPVGRPVGLLNTVQGDHLVCLPRLRLRGPDTTAGSPAAGGEAAGGAGVDDAGEADLAGPDMPRGEVPVLGWASSGGSSMVTLPMPPEFRPPEGVPGDAELAGALVPVRDGDLEAGLLLLLDPGDGRSLGGHLLRRSPDLAQHLAPDAAVGAVVCRWSSAGGPSQAQPPLPAAGSRVWAQGLLVADPGASLSPVRALAWALDADGKPVTAAPGTGSWPETVLTWRLLMLPLPDVAGPAPCAFYLPLPGRDGEPGTATTLTPVSERGTGRSAERRSGGRAAAAPALVPGVTGSRRVLRMAMVPAQGGRLQTFGCTVRVHLPGSTRDRH